MIDLETELDYTASLNSDKSVGSEALSRFFDPPAYAGGTDLVMWLIYG
jgi:hypothetical protein